MRGGDTTALKTYNERLVIDAIRQEGPLSQADIARVTGLSGQAASMIVKRLMAAGMVIKGKKVRGRIGQPSTPICLNPKGAYSLGVKIGRRSVEAALVNLLGETIRYRKVEHSIPEPELCLSTAHALSKELMAEIAEDDQDRIVGLGIAMPSDLHSWTSELGLAPGALDGWRNLDVAARLAALTGLAVTVHNDATAACAAEMIAGDAIQRKTALYVFVGSFIGAGVVIEGKLYLGAKSNAGAFASMPTCRSGKDGKPEQLLRSASIISLEEALNAAGLDARSDAEDREDTEALTLFGTWMASACSDIARATVSACSIIDFDAVVVDGLFTPRQRALFTDRLAAEFEEFDLRGLLKPEMKTGTIGPMARVLGAALLPLKARFSPNPEALVNAGSTTTIARNEESLEEPQVLG